MEKTLSVNYPVLSQKKGVLLNTFVKNIRFLSVHSIFLSLLASRIDEQCCIFRPWCFSKVFNNTPLFCLSSHLVSSPSISCILLVYSPVCLRCTIIMDDMEGSQTKCSWWNLQLKNIQKYFVKLLHLHLHLQYWNFSFLTTFFLLSKSSISGYSCFKNIYISLIKKKCINSLFPLTARGGGARPLRIPLFLCAPLVREVNLYEKSCDLDFCKLFCVHLYNTKEAKVYKGVHLFFSFPKNILSNIVKKVCYKIKLRNSKFVI